MQPKEFHLWDFPDNKIRLLLTDKINKQFFHKTERYFGNLNCYSRFLKTSSASVLSWKNKKIFIPLWVLKKTIPKIKFCWKRIEKNISAYKGINTSLPVKKTILPLRETPQLFELITHLIGDGCVSKRGMPQYTNSNITLIKNFKNLLKKCFGDVNGKLYKTNNCYTYCFSKIVPDLIKHFYDVRFMSSRAFLPRKVFFMPKQFVYSIIRAIIDDEGNIRENRIIIKMKSKKFMSQFEKLLVKALSRKNVSTLRNRKNDFREITVYSSGMKKFQDKIELVHPKKRSDLRYAVERLKIKKTKIRGMPLKTKIGVLNILKNKSFLAKDLSHKFLINMSSINTHLNQLLEKGMVKKKKVKNSYIWSITTHGLKFLDEHVTPNKLLAIKLPKLNRHPDTNLRTLLKSNVRERLFWFLESIFENQQNIGIYFKTSKNTISNWKRGLSTIPLTTLNKMLIKIANYGINITSDINNGIQEIRHLNGHYKIHGGDYFGIVV